MKLSRLYFRAIIDAGTRTVGARLRSNVAGLYLPLVTAFNYSDRNKTMREKLRDLHTTKAGPFMYAYEFAAYIMD